MIRVRVLLAVGVSCAACSATTSQRDVPTSTTAIPRVCAGPDPLDVATKFVHAVKAADPCTYQQCEDPTRQFDANTIESVAAGNSLIDKRVRYRHRPGEADRCIPSPRTSHRRRHQHSTPSPSCSQAESSATTNNRPRPSYTEIRRSLRRRNVARRTPARGGRHAGDRAGTLTADTNGAVEAVLFAAISVRGHSGIRRRAFGEDHSWRAGVEVDACEG